MKNIILLLISLVAFSIATGGMIRQSKFFKQETLPAKDTFVVTATMYQPLAGQTDSDPNITADGSIIDPENASEHHWIAVSRNLLKRWGGCLDYGDKVELHGAGHKDGIYEIHDTMNKRCVNQIDILESPDVDLYKFKNVRLVRT